MNEKPQRLDRLLSSLGYATRKEVNGLLREGRVSVAGVLASSSAQRVLASEVKVDQEHLDQAQGFIALFYKPAGYVCSHSGTGPLIYDLLPERWIKRRPVVSSVGRLDLDTSGLLLLTDNGALLHRLTSPKYKIPKVYEVELEQELRGDEVSLFASGTLILEGERKALLPAELKVVAARQVTLTLFEGRFHQVKRMFEHVGNKVLKLHRAQIGHLTLDQLKPAEFRYLNGEELSLLILGRS